VINIFGTQISGDTVLSLIILFVLLVVLIVLGKAVINFFFRKSWWITAATIMVGLIMVSMLLPGYGTPVRVEITHSLATILAAYLGFLIILRAAMGRWVWQKKAKKTHAP
jgi:hypothetical protein